MDGIQSLFWPVLAVVTALSLIAAVVALARSGKQWDDYGRQHLLMERDPDRGGAERSATTTATRERDDEIRELLAARNERRRRRGEATIDVEAELTRLTTPPSGQDPARAPSGQDPARAPSGQDPVRAPSGQAPARATARDAPRIDAALRAEIRDLVIARNHRRTRAGKPALDVEAEVEREIQGLSGLH